MDKKYTVDIIQDENPESPRNLHTNLGTMVCFHKRYHLGDEDHGYASSDYRIWAELEEAIRARKDVAVILPIYMYDHSGITISTTPFQCPWDSGQIGFIFVSKKKIRKELCLKNLTQKVLSRVSNIIKSEVEEYDLYLRGEVYGYVIKDEDGNVVDSCWGYYGLDYCPKDAKEALESATKRQLTPFASEEQTSPAS
jgi:hypothetical protein